MAGRVTGPRMRHALKRGLAGASSPVDRAPARGSTLLIYHRLGGDTTDELDLPVAAFEEQVELLTRHRVLSLDDALDDLDADDERPSVVLTFDDGFAGIYEHAWPLLRAAGLAFTIYVATAYIGGVMRWPGSTATGEPGAGLTWAQLEELADSPLVTIANHTHTHARPEALSAQELDRCSEALEHRLGVTPKHFAFTWGEPVPSARSLLAERFRSAATGAIGRNLPDVDRLELNRVPVRATDPLPFFAAKLGGDLRAERAYGWVVGAAKRFGASA